LGGGATRCQEGVAPAGTVQPAAASIAAAIAAAVQDVRRSIAAA